MGKSGEKSIKAKYQPIDDAGPCKTLKSSRGGNGEIRSVKGRPLWVGIARVLSLHRPKLYRE